MLVVYIDKEQIYRGNVSLIWRENAKLIFFSNPFVSFVRSVEKE